MNHDPGATASDFFNSLLVVGARRRDPNEMAFEPPYAPDVDALPRTMRRVLSATANVLPADAKSENAVTATATEKGY